MSFIRLPDGTLTSVNSIGGVKAFTGGFVVLGTATNDVLFYIECPLEVAVIWRNMLADLLVKYRPNRHVEQIRWFALANTLDSAWTKQWAVSQCLSPAEYESLIALPQGLRRMPSAPLPPPEPVAEITGLENM